MIADPLVVQNIYQRMAPALTTQSDTSLSVKGNNNSLTPSYSGVLQTSSDSLLFNGVRNVKEERDNVSKKNVICRLDNKALTSHQIDLNKISCNGKSTVNDYPNITLSRKMNPSDGSSIEDIKQTSQPQKRKESPVSKMCGTLTTPLSVDKRMHEISENKLQQTEDDKSRKRIMRKRSHSNKAKTHESQKEMQSAVIDKKGKAGTSKEASPTFTTHTRQTHLTKRVGRLLHRVRHIQAQQVTSHGRQQIAAFIDNQKGSVEETILKPIVEDPALDLKDAQSMSTSALVNYVQKWQAQQPVTKKPNQKEDKPVRLDDEMCTEVDQISGHLIHETRHMISTCDSDATESSSGDESCDEGDYDFDWGEKIQPSLDHRVDWQWCKDRAEIAARWTWLQAQVSDLEYRIRQQSEICKQIRTKKGEIKLEEINPDRVSSETRLQILQQSGMSPANVSPLVSNVTEQSMCLKQQLGNILTPSPANEGALQSVTLANTQTVTPVLKSSSSQSSTPVIPSSQHSSQPSSQTSHSSIESVVEKDKLIHDSGDCVAARCRPVVLGKYRKRKLIRTSSVPRNRKHARMESTVKCQCYPPVTPCALCGGRVNFSVTDYHFSSVPERVALLDHSYHHVLSLQEDVPLSVHFGGLLKTGEWQRFVMEPSGSVRFGHLNGDKRQKQYQLKEKRRSTKKTVSLEVLSRIKSKYSSERGLSALPLSPDKKRLNRIAPFRIKKKKAALHDVLRKKERSKLLGENGESVTVRDMREHARRRAQSAYDINNIVIPYSIAASTRVQVLHYKEILTPSWREVCSERQRTASQANCDETSSDTADIARNESIAIPVIVPEIDEATCVKTEELPDEEDVSEAAVEARHMRSEREEKEKFLAYSGTTTSKMAAGGSAHKRSRGRASESAHSSGVMTPDASSPDIPENQTSFHGANGATPPSTPCPMDVSSGQLTPVQQHGAGDAANAALGVHTPNAANAALGVHTPNSSSGDLTSNAVRAIDMDGDGRPRSDSVNRRRASSVSSLHARHRSTSHSEHYSAAAHHHESGWTKRQFPLNEDEERKLYIHGPTLETTSGVGKYSLRASSRAVHVPRTSTSRDVGEFALLDSPPQSPASTSTSQGGGASSHTTVSATETAPDEWTVKPIRQTERRDSIVLKIAKR